MAAVTSNFIQKIIIALINDSIVQNNIARDKNGNLSVHVAKLPTGAVLPEITIDEEEMDSEPQFPATRTRVTIIVWIDTKTTRPNYSFLKTISDEIITIFNREGSKYNEIDVPTNTGVRVCNILKTTRDINYDEILKYHYAEVIFEAVISEDESFAAADAGNKVWS